MAFQSGWYVAYTKVRHEKKVGSQLVKMEVTHLTPTIRSVSHWHDRKKMIEKPIFPSYVFIYLTDNLMYYRCLEIPGLLYFIKTGSTISKINVSVIENIRLINGSQSDIEVSSDYFAPGQQTIISTGLFAGTMCEIVKIKNKSCILVRVNLLNRNIIVSVSSNVLAIADTFKPISEKDRG